MSTDLYHGLLGDSGEHIASDLKVERLALPPSQYFVGGERPDPIAVLSRYPGDVGREDQGADRFVRVLRFSQKEGMSNRPRGTDKTRHFELMNDATTKRTIISGPFLGAPAMAKKDPPTDFYGDHLEFLRAYRSCFLNWLRTKGSGSGKTSSKKFAELLIGIAHMDDSSGLEGKIAEAFKMDALSTEKLGTKDLEGRFLKWLSKQK